MEEVPQINEFTMMIQANVINNIAPQMPARIKKIYAEVGDFVVKGQKLVQMDDNNLEQIRTAAWKIWRFHLGVLTNCIKWEVFHGQNGMPRRQVWK